jgi:hypothetical protein
MRRARQRESAVFKSTPAYSTFRLRIIFATDYIWTSRFTMADTYRMTPHGSEFIINHNAGGTVGVYKTEMETRQEMADCQQDDLMLKTARGLVEKAVSALMRTHHIDRQAAHGWITERRTGILPVLLSATIPFLVPTKLIRKTLLNLCTAGNYHPADVRGLRQSSPWKLHRIVPRPSLCPQ